MVVGTKSGNLAVLDIASASLWVDIQAHDAAIWSICIDHEEHSLTTGSADKQVKMWEIVRSRREPTDYIGSEGESVHVPLTLRHSRTLKLSADVLAIKYSPNSKYLAVALLDSTVKVFYRDTLKVYLSLYGHKVRPTYVSRR